MKKKINEIFQDQPNIQEKLTKLLISESELSEETDNDYAIDEIQNSSDSSQESQESLNNLCNCNQINVITRDNDKQFLLDIIDKIDDPDTRKEYLIKLKDIINQENKISTPKPFSLNKIFEKYPTQSLFKQITTGDLQNEIKQIKSQIKELQITINKQELNQLQLNARLAIVENQPSTSNPNEEFDQDKDYIQVIERINYQKWYTTINLHIGHDFKISIIALVDSGADLNCIREGLVPTKYYEKTTERLHGASGDTLKVQYKLSSAKICNQGYCFKNQFILVKNLTQEVILGTPFITQIYPFKVTELGLTTKVVGSKISFDFLSPMKTKEILNLQNNTISKTINLIKAKQNHI